ncbi:MAG TPA: 3'-5' exonuclease, partial [bacterium]|nr:3'-5' exonuclease [bacterium]
MRRPAAAPRAAGRRASSGRALDEEGGLEEERRLCYVGMTRAKQRLYLSYARNRVIFGSATPGIPSRFLDEVPA